MRHQLAGRIWFIDINEENYLLTNNRITNRELVAEVLTSRVLMILFVAPDSSFLFNQVLLHIDCLALTSIISIYCPHLCTNFIKLPPLTNLQDFYAITGIDKKKIHMYYTKQNQTTIFKLRNFHESDLNRVIFTIHHHYHHHHQL